MGEVSVESIISRIVFVRGLKGMLDFHLASLYGVTTIRLSPLGKTEHLF